MPIDPDQVKALFLEAIQKATPEQRSAYLREACADNDELRGRIESLLAAHDAAGGFQEQHVSAVTRGSAVSSPNPPTVGHSSRLDRPAEGVGAIVGPYKLLQKLGEGGMGSVFLAEQRTPVVRKVALKVMKTGLDSASVVARFEQERQALALMDHPNIAKVLDAGATEAGRPYLVMDLVKGIPITKYCDEEHLTPQERLELFVPVCLAIQHAHQKGIIHRDLKPSNVLVALYDGRPVPKVIDFGVAKATQQRLSEHTMFTEVGQVVGTLEYMAPEQAELNNLDIDTRADIYSLGVLLYELLTGSPPFSAKQLRSAAFAEMLRIIREVEPPRPSTRLSTATDLASIAAKRKLEPARLTKVIYGDLDWIVMKALDKDRGRRYETAKGFAEDLQRYLADEPVIACPPSTGYRLKKFLRRNKGPVFAASLALAALIAGIIGTTWGLVRAVQAEAAVKGEQVKTQLALDEVMAEQAKTKAALLAETAAKQQTRAALEALSDTVVESAFAKQESLGEEESKFLQKVLEFYKGYTNTVGDTSEARRIQAQAGLRVGRILDRLGRRADAESAFQGSFRLAEHLVTEHPSIPEYRLLLALSQNSLGLLLWEAGNSSEAERQYRQAIASMEKVAAEAGSAGNRSVLGLIRRNLAVVLQQAGKTTEAEGLLRAAQTDLESAAATQPAEPSYRHSFAILGVALGSLLERTGRGDKALEEYGKAAATLEKLAAEVPTAPDYRESLADVQTRLGALLHIRLDHGGAESAHRRSLELYQQLAAQFPGVPRYRKGLATSLQGAAASVRKTNSLDEAQMLCRDGVAVWEKLAADYPEQQSYRAGLASAQLALGKVMTNRDKGEDAEEHLRKALAGFEALHRAAPAVSEHAGNLVRSGNGLAAALQLQARSVEAVDELQKALALGTQLAEKHPGDFVYRNLLGETHVAFARVLGEDPQALEHFRKAVDLAQPTVPDDAMDWNARRALASIRVGYAAALLRSEKPVEARGQLTQAVTDFGKLPKSVETDPADWRRLAAAWLEVGDVEQGASALGRLLEDAKTRAAKTAVRVDEFRELRNADTSALSAWIKALPAGFRPVSLTSHAQADPPRFNAIAIRDGQNLSFEFSMNLDKPNRRTRGDDWENRGNKWINMIECPFTEEGKQFSHRVWIADSVDACNIESHKKGEVSNQYPEWKQNGLRVWRLALPNSPGRDPNQCNVIMGPREGLEWEVAFDLSGEQLVEKVDRVRQRGWRPDALQAVASESKVLYSAVFVSNPTKSAWEFRRDLSGDACGDAIKELQGRGLRPLAIVSHGSPQAPRYTACWVDVEMDRRNAVRTAEISILKESGLKLRDHDLARSMETFRKLQALAPDDTEPMQLMASILAEYGDWKASAAFYDELAKRGEQGAADHRAISLVMSGQVEAGLNLPSHEYTGSISRVLLLEFAGHTEKARKRLGGELEQNRSTADATVAHMAARTVGLLPGSDLDRVEALRLAELAIKLDPVPSWHYFTLALSRFRLGQFAEADEAALETSRRQPEWAPGSVSLLRALIAHKQGRIDDARSLFEKGKKAPERFWDHYYHFLEYRLLLREAESLILAKK